MAEFNEFKFIEIASKIFKTTKKSVIAGAGDDDCAVVNIGEKFVVLTTDNLHEKADFPAGMLPEEMGHMALAVNLSDLAGTGAKPEFFLFDITLREGMTEDFFIKVLRGMAKLAKRYDVAIVGGDIDLGDELFITGFAAGIADRYILQSGAKPGENIYLTDMTGKAQLSLEMLFSGKDREEIPYASKLFTPVPRVEEGIVASRYAGAMTDISDSLAISLNLISRKSGVRMDIFERDISLDHLTEFVDKRKALELFLYAGGDYELIFTAEESNIGYRIGEVRKGKGVYFVKEDGDREKIEFRGYSHF